jgi:NAD(P)H dehydrogenase (quinone)
MSLLVTGASGQLGRRVLELLLEAGAKNIIATTRTPEKLADFAQQGITVRPADFDDPTSLKEAFAGVDRLLLISTDKVGFAGERIQQHLNAVAAAESAGVKHVLYTSLINPGPDSPVALAPDHHATETALEKSGMGWTFLRNSIYADGLVGTLSQAVQMGNVYSAAGDGKITYILREDCARAAAAALADSFVGRRTLDITGADALSQADLAKIAADISGKPVGYVPLTRDVLIDNMVAAGLPRPLAEVYSSFDAGAAAGQFEVVSNTVEELTGRKPTRVADYLAANKAALLGTAAV